MEQSGTGLGNAFAGMTATAEDASNQSYNPASLSFLSPERQLSVGGTLVFLNVGLQDGMATNDVLGTSVSGRDGGNAGKTTLAPNFYLASEQMGKFRYGLGVTAPYGLGLAYDQDWMGRYHGVEADFLAVDINPAFSYQLSERISLGMGVSIQYAQLKSKTAIDSSAICLYSAPSPACTALGLGMPGNASADSHVDLDGDDISGGVNLGVMYKASPALTLGLAYRSGIEHDIEGEADYSLSDPMSTFLAIGGSSSLQDTRFNSQINLPQLVTLGVHYKPNSDWDLLADLAWTGWSEFESLEVDFDNPSQPSSRTDHNWNDSWRLSLGASRRLNDRWKFRTGLSYDRTPVPRTSLRTVGIPDADRLTLALGIAHEMNDKTRFELAYAHLFASDANIRSSNATGHTLQGEFDLSANLLSFQLVRKF